METVVGFVRERDESSVVVDRGGVVSVGNLDVVIEGKRGVSGVLAELLR